MANTTIDSRIDAGLIDLMLIDGDLNVYANVPPPGLAEQTTMGSAARIDE